MTRPESHLIAALTDAPRRLVPTRRPVGFRFRLKAITPAAPG
jgi:hypothetical protein